MNLVDLFSASIFYRTQDGRIYFRPLGKRGPCYELNEQQRKVRAWAQFFYYCVLFGSISFAVIDVTDFRRLALPLGLFILGNYVLYALFTIGLPRVAPPPTPSRDQALALRRERVRAMGRPMLNGFYYGSLAFSLVGLIATIVGPRRLELFFSFVFFAACAVVFRRALRLQKSI